MNSYIHCIGISDFFRYEYNRVEGLWKRTKFAKRKDYKLYSFRSLKRNEFPIILLRKYVGDQKKETYDEKV
jgi:hypothetical protein